MFKASYLGLGLETCEVSSLHISKPSDRAAIGDTVSTKEQRQALKSRLPSTQLTLSHTQQCIVLPDRLDLLNRLPKQAVVAEIGVAFGDFSKEILARCDPSRVYLIDAWEGDRYAPGLETIRKDLAEEIASRKVRIAQSYSTTKLRQFPDTFFDWVYIDTNHTYKTTWSELVICDNKVKPDGRIAGHDFCTGNVIEPVAYGVIEAVTRFCSEFNWQFEYLTLESHGHFSFCLKRLTV